MRIQRGFSFVELVVAVGLLALILALGGLSLSHGRGKSGAHGLSIVLVEELRRIRQEAITRRHPVAMVFPSGGGAFRHTQSYYVLEGETSPQVVRSHSFKADFGSACVFVGDWPLLGGATALASSLLVTGSKFANFSVSAWVAGHSSDYAYIFLPDGTVRTNDLPSVDGTYRLVVASGVEYVGSTLSRSGEAFTININPGGGVTLTGGLYAQGGAVVTEGAIGLSAPGPDPPALQVPLAGTITLLTTPPRVYPDPSTYYRPPGVDAYLTKDQFITLEIVATSSTGEQLYCNWVAQASTSPPNSTPGAGYFSFPIPAGQPGGRMEWDPQANGGTGAWRAIWQWRPPATAQPNDKFSLSCQVQNQAGGVVNAAIPNVEVIPPGRILFQTDRNGGSDIYSMNENGSNQKVYLAGCSQPSATTDGSRIAYIKNGDVWVNFPARPGTDIQLTSSNDASIPSMSPAGNFVAYRRGGSIYVRKTASGSSEVPVDAVPPPTLPECEKLAWSPDGAQLLYPKGPTIYACTVSQGGGANPVVVGNAQLLNGSAHGGPLSSVTWGLGGPGGPLGTIFHCNDYNSPIYDPWVWGSSGGSPASLSFMYESVANEDVMVERCPRPSFQLLSVRTSDLTGHTDRQIYIRDTSVYGYVAPAQGALSNPLTSSGNNTRPCWTQ